MEVQRLTKDTLSTRARSQSEHAEDELSCTARSSLTKNTSNTRGRSLSEHAEDTLSCSTRTSGSRAIGMNVLNFTHNLLERREHAEDESVRDLRIALHAMCEHGEAESDGNLRKAMKGMLASKAGLDKQGSKARAKSESPPETPVEDLPNPEIGRFRDVAQPGGFRRFHVRSTVRQSLASVESLEAGGQPSQVQTSLVQNLWPMLRVDELEDSDCASVRSHHEREGDNSIAGVAFVIAKNFFGSCFNITPKGFQESGFLAGPLCLTFVYLMELRCMQNLIRCRRELTRLNSGAFVPDYEDLGSEVGRCFRHVITVQICLCQFGFVCIWLVTNMENLSMLLPDWNATQRLWIQLPILIPLVWIRKLRLFAVTNLIGIIFTVIMVVFFFIFMGNHLVKFGPQPVQMINTRNADLLIWLGTCAYAYEGINLVLPLYESAKDKETMPKLLTSITAFNTLIYISFGCLTYLALGSEVASLASLNLPRGSPEGQMVPGVCLLIGLVSLPLQAFVIFQNYERKLTWSTSNLKRKWQKNLARSLLLVVAFMLTWLGGDELQNFLGLVGGFCCASLALIFPSLLHIIICKPTGVGRCMDAAIFFFGICILVVSTVQSLASWK